MCIRDSTHTHTHTHTHTYMYRQHSWPMDCCMCTCTYIHIHCASICVLYTCSCTREGGEGLCSFKTKTTDNSIKRILTDSQQTKVCAKCYDYYVIRKGSILASPETQNLRPTLNRRCLYTIIVFKQTVFEVYCTECFVQ